MPTQVSVLPELEYLRECFDYSILTGDLWWKERPREHFKSVSVWKSSNTNFESKKAGTISSKGYLDVKVNGKLYRVHRILYKLIMEVDPPRFIDHIDGDRLNNAWQNLRNATKEENSRNRRMSSINTTGFKGVSFRKDIGKYTAYINYKKLKKHLGVFDTPEEAYAAYCEAALKYHGEFANFGAVT